MAKKRKPVPLEIRSLCGAGFEVIEHAFAAFVDNDLRLRLRHDRLEGVGIVIPFADVRAAPKMLG